MRVLGGSAGQECRCRRTWQVEVALWAEVELGSAPERHSLACLGPQEHTCLEKRTQHGDHVQASVSVLCPRGPGGWGVGRRPRTAHPAGLTPSELLSHKPLTRAFPPAAHGVLENACFSFIRSRIHSANAANSEKAKRVCRVGENEAGTGECCPQADALVIVGEKHLSHTPTPQDPQAQVCVGKSGREAQQPACRGEVDLPAAGGWAVGL